MTSIFTRSKRDLQAVVLLAGIAAGSTMAAGPVSYSVKKGDTLSGIAKAHGLSTDCLASANRQLTDPHALTIGQQLSLSGARGGDCPAIPRFRGKRQETKTFSTAAAITYRLAAVSATRGLLLDCDSGKAVVVAVGDLLPDKRRITGMRPRSVQAETGDDVVIRRSCGR